jgi:hypothetical protein
MEIGREKERPGGGRRRGREAGWRQGERKGAGERLEERRRGRMEAGGIISR